MKTIIAIIFAIAALFALAPPSQAQSRQNPNTVAPFFYYNVTSGATYADSQTDTSAAYRLGAAKLLSLEFFAYDTVAADIYVDYRPWGGSAWTQILADSLVDTVNTGTMKEIPLRTAAVDSIGYVSGDLRTRVAFRSSKNGVTSPTYTERWIWKP